MEAAAELGARGFDGQLRRYQQQALEAFEGDWARGNRHSYLVLPPGAGKTVVGLEGARRLGRRTLVLVPNHAVLGQWADTWDHRFPPARGAAAVTPCGTDRDLAGPLTVLTYQSIAVIDDTIPARQRREIMGGRDRDALLGLLHPNGRAVIDRAATAGPWTVVLDECHHLLATWGALVRALVEELGGETAVIGLTATPARTLTRWQRELHDEIFGSTDFEVPTPALVKEGDLAPYQELVYLTAPTPEEDSWLASEKARFADLQVELIDHRLGTIPLAEWLRRRLSDRGTESGVSQSWGAFETTEPALALAGLRFANTGLIAVPDGARLREQHRIPPDADDWVCLLTDFCVGHLQRSEDPRDVDALAAIRAVLPSLGFRLTTRGVRATTSPVDRVCGLSEAKVAATVALLAAEASALGPDLRALVLCDFETQTARLPSSLRGSPLSVASGSARLTAATLARADMDGCGGLRPVLITGASFACAASLGDDLVRFCADAGHAVKLQPPGGDPDLTEVVGSSALTTRECVRIATGFFVAGGSRVLVGTRALLGEGWDCVSVNVTVDLTTAATPTAITQMRGRSLRLDPVRLDKLADNWTVCCVSADHPRGDADYDRLVRKHEAYFATTAQATIESGVSHCDPRLSPFGPPTAADALAVTTDALGRVAERDRARQGWRIGQPYAGLEAATVRVRTGRSLGIATDPLPSATLLPALPGGQPSGWGRAGVAGAVTGVGVVGALVGVTAGTAPGVAVAGALAVLGVLILLGATLVRGKRMATAPPALERIAHAVADGLRLAGLSEGGAEAVTLETTPDGWLRCALTGASTEQSEHFAAALDELLAPLTEPRYLLGRMVVTPAASELGRLSFALRATLRLPLDAAVAWHTVPRPFTVNQRRRQCFLTAWEQHVGPARLLAADSAEAAAVLELFRGEDPFSITTQLRTTWS